MSSRTTRPRSSSCRRRCPCSCSPPYRRRCRPATGTLGRGWWAWGRHSCRSRPGCLGAGLLAEVCLQIGLVGEISGEISGERPASVVDLPSGTAGVLAEPAEPSLGAARTPGGRAHPARCWRSAATGAVLGDDARLPRRHRVGRRGLGGGARQKKRKRDVNQTHGECWLQIDGFVEQSNLLANRTLLVQSHHQPGSLYNHFRARLRASHSRVIFTWTTPYGPLRRRPLRNIR